MQLKILIIIPAFNEESNIGKLLNIISSIHPLNEVLVIDDGSIDNTSGIVTGTGVHLIEHPHNMGKGEALETGYKYAIANNYEAVITMDSDLQHDPLEIPKFIKEYTESTADLIIGTRKHRIREMPFIRVLVNESTSLVASLLTGIRIHDSQSGFRLISTDLLRNIELKTYRFQAETEIIVRAVRAGYKVREIPIRSLYFKNAKSNINPFLDTLRFIILSLRLLWR